MVQRDTPYLIRFWKDYELLNQVNEQIISATESEKLLLSESLFSHAEPYIYVDILPTNVKAHFVQLKASYLKCCLRLKMS